MRRFSESRKSLEVLGTQTRLHQMNVLVQLELCERVRRTSGTSVALITGTTVMYPQLEDLIAGITLTLDWPPLGNS
jgi:hypothetical protein